MKILKAICLFTTNTTLKLIFNAAKTNLVINENLTIKMTRPRLY